MFSDNWLNSLRAIISYTTLNPAFGLVLVQTALLEVADSVRIAVDSGASSMLVLLDLSAAFDMVDHDILVRRLQDSRISGAALAWMKSFLYKRTQRVALQPYQSEQKHLWCGVPQGSALSPLLLNIYLAPLFTLIAN